MANVTCTFDGCGFPATGRGLCAAHYAQSRRGIPLRPVRRDKRTDGGPRKCVGPNCEYPAIAHGLCGSHRRQQTKGRPLTPLKPHKPGGVASACIRDEQGRKRCWDCGEWRAESEFHRGKREPDGLCGQCKDCMAEATRAHRLAKFGLTLESFDALLDAQGGACAICRKPCPRGGALSVDHDHTCCPESDRSCGECVRGLLCRPCNVALGNLRDDPKILRRAAEYLEQAG